MLLYGAIECGVHISPNDLTMPMLVDLMEYKTKISGGSKEESGEVKSLSEIAKHGKL